MRCTLGETAKETAFPLLPDPDPDPVDDVLDRPLAAGRVVGVDGRSLDPPWGCRWTRVASVLYPDPDPNARG